MIKRFFSYSEIQNLKMFLGVFILASTCFGSHLFAKGLDSFSAPSKPAANTQGTQPSLQPSATPAASQPSVQPSSSNANLAPNNGGVVATNPSTETKTFVKSEISKRFENKLSLGMNFGWIGLTASEGDWSARAIAGVDVGYEFTKMGSFPLVGVLGFSASDATVMHEKDGSKNNFRALIQTYSLGVLTKQSFRDAWNWRASVDLDLHVVSLDSLDGLVQDDIDDDLKASGVSIRVYGGADWKWQENFLIGPGLGLGFGRFSTVQFLAKSTFVF